MCLLLSTSTGETDLETIATSTADSFEAVGDNAGLEFTGVQGSGSGTGSDGGFDIGNHLAFNGDGELDETSLKPQLIHQSLTLWLLQQSEVMMKMVVKILMFLVKSCVFIIFHQVDLHLDLSV